MKILFNQIQQKIPSSCYLKKKTLNAIDNFSFEHFCESLQSISLKIVDDSTSQLIIIHQPKILTDNLYFCLDVT